MSKTLITIHPKYVIGDISPRLYGGFLEPIGTLVNGSMYNPKHPTADEQGFRKDFYTALKESGIPCIRMPGGNYVSGWRWKDSIGPKAARKQHLDLAWNQYITNEVGLDEYLQWAEKTGAEPLWTLNLGTDGLNEAIDLVEYTNRKSNTYWSDLRKKNGHDKPYDIKIWYLGNEVDGPWQIGSFEKDPRSYGVLCHELSKVMKWTDSRIQTAVCASSSQHLAHYPVWEHEVLEQCYETVDYISMHHYHAAPPGDWKALLGGSVYFEDYINTEIALADYLKEEFHSDKKLMLSLDEYGSFVRPLDGYKYPGEHQHVRARFHYPKGGEEEAKEFVLHNPDKMIDEHEAEHHGMTEALSTASTLLAFMRHADRVKIACMTGGIQVAAPVTHEGIWKSAAYYPFTQLMHYGKGLSLQTIYEGDSFDLPGYAIDDVSQNAGRCGLPYIDTAAAMDVRANNHSSLLNIFAINRDDKNTRPVEFDLSAFGDCTLLEHSEMTSEEGPKANTKTVLKNGKLNADLQKLSWNVFRIKL
ncbi:MAG: hypothetical protein LBM77_04495 [Spirochaetaceae bacterium]|jgi:alpha-N-arabinofuranosidase|nr:hypothetical protein [Spirochaetaceae bacterium]